MHSVVIINLSVVHLQMMPFSYSNLFNSIFEQKEIGMKFSESENEYILLRVDERSLDDFSLFFFRKSHNNC